MTKQVVRYECNGILILCHKGNEEFRVIERCLWTIAERSEQNQEHDIHNTITM